MGGLLILPVFPLLLVTRMCRVPHVDTPSLRAQHGAVYRPGSSAASPGNTSDKEFVT